MDCIEEKYCGQGYHANHQGEKARDLKGGWNLDKTYGKDGDEPKEIVCVEKDHIFRKVVDRVESKVDYEGGQEEWI